MKRLFFATIAVGLVGTATAAPTCVYRNGNNDGGTSTIIANNLVTSGEQSERGDTITLAPGPRNVTEVTLGYGTDITVPNGTEAVIIRFYQEDGTPASSGSYTHNSPNTLIWASSPIPVTKFGGRGYIRVPVPNITVPDTFVWTAQWQNVTGSTGNRLQWRFVGPPTVGTSDSSHWRRNTVASGFSLFNNTYNTGNTPEGSIEFTVWADGGPEGVVYDSTQSDTRNSYLAPGFDTDPTWTAPCGDDTYLEGSHRELTQIELELYTDVTVPNGDEQIEISFWNIDNLDNGTAAAFYTSTPTLVNLGSGAAGFNITVISLPNVTVPDWFITAISISGTTQFAGDLIGWKLRSEPNPGHSQIVFPYRTFRPGHVNGWIKYWFGNPTRTNTWPTVDFFNNYVANFGIKMTASNTENLAPTNGIPGPGTAVSGTYANAYASDDVRWETRPGAILVATAFPERVTWTFQAKSTAASALELTIESSATVAGIEQKVYIQHDDGSYAELEDFTGLPFGANPDRSVTLSVSGTLSDYIRDDGTITVRTEHKNTTAVLVYPWRVRYDRIHLTLTP